MFLALVSCTNEPPGLSGNRERWEQAGVDDYRWSVSAQCFGACGSVVVTVRNHEPVKVKYWPPRGDAEEFLYPPLTVDRLFTDLAERSADVDEVRPAYNPALGYPMEVLFDYEEQAIDDELTYVVEFLRPR
jgi:hypothetical protein